MSNGPKWFRINFRNGEIQAITSRETQVLKEVEFAHLEVSERYDIQEWIAAYPSILDDDLLIIGKEFSGFDRSSERPDLLAVDRGGKLVVIELKRDDSGEDVHCQAIKYASYLSHARVGEIVGILANHEQILQLNAEAKLRGHIAANDLSTLNHDQRIILAGHRFAPQVTSAVL